MWTHIQPRGVPGDRSDLRAPGSSGSRCRTDDVDAVPQLLGVANTIIKVVSGENSTLYSSLISALAGLAGVGVGGFVTYRVEKNRAEAARKIEGQRAARDAAAEERRTEETLRAVSRVEEARLAQWAACIVTSLDKKVWVPVGVEPRIELSSDDTKLLLGHLEREELAPLIQADMAIRGLLVSRDLAVAHAGMPGPVIPFQAFGDESQFRSAQEAIVGGIAVVRRLAEGP